jgi:catechol 2,3-dioxygenase-like lactoylglutathione lyase family enzyme
MTSKFNHFTILSEDNYALGRYYEAFFHMRSSGQGTAAADDVHIGDGRIGINIKPRLSGHPAQLDQFGIEVDDLAAVRERLRKNHPTIGWIERPSNTIATHDPVGNVFVVSQVGGKNREGFYEMDGRSTNRVVDHFALRVRRPQVVAEFYEKVFGLMRLDRLGGTNTYLSDGEITMVIIPWRLCDFEETGISARGMDHIGFRVESIDALKADIARITARNFRFQPSETVVGRGKEGKGRLDMFRKACPLGCHHMADADGLLLDVRE